MPPGARENGGLGSPAATTDVSSSATQPKEMIQNPWQLPDFSINEIAGPVPDLDMMMMDTQLCADDFEGVEDLSFLDELF